MSKRRPAGIAIGRDRRGVPRGIDTQQFMRSGLITGSVGAGKTWTAIWIVSRAIRAGFGAILVEAKGDPKVERWAMAEAMLRGVPFYFFRIAGDSLYWNALASAAGAVERRDLIFEATRAEGELEHPYYVGLFKKHALAVLRVLEAAGIPASFPAVYKHWPFKTLTNSVPRKADLPSETRQYLKEMLDDGRANERAQIQSTAVRLADLVDPCKKRLEVDNAGPGEVLGLREIVARRAICLISLDASAYPAVTKSLGQLVVADAMAACAPCIEREELARTVLWLDEFGRYAGPRVGELMALSARAAGMPVILATQDVSDLDAVSPTFRGQVMGVANWFAAHTTSNPDSADFLARAAAMRERIEATHQTHRLAFGYERLTGLGTEAHGREWIIHPNELQRLDVGQTALVTKNPHRAHVVDVYPADAPGQLLERINDKRAIDNKPTLDFGQLASLHATARAAVH